MALFYQSIFLGLLPISLSNNSIFFPSTLLCFGTRAATFHLGTVTGRGTLEPKVIEVFGRIVGGRQQRAQHYRGRASVAMFMPPT
jgi:hypothetical protein